MLCYEKPKVDPIIAHLKKCPKEIILKHLDELIEIFDTKHNDSIKGVFSISDDILKNAIKNTKKMIEKLYEFLRE